MEDPINNLNQEAKSLERITDVLGYLNIGFVVAAAIVTIATFFISDKLAKAKERISDLKIAKANEGISIAQSEIEKSKVVIATTNEKAQKASQSAQEAKNKQAELEIEMANARARQADAERKQSIAELELMKLKQSLAPRLLSKHQQDKLHKLLVQYPGSRVIIDNVLADSESEQLALELEKIFQSAGWNIEASAKQYTVTPVGMSVYVQNPSPFASALLNLIQEIDPSAKGFIDVKLKAPIAISIGIKNRATN
ncbi:hypothetical protein [Spirosoma aerophilum]